MTVMTSNVVTEHIFFICLHWCISVHVRGTGGGNITVQGGGGNDYVPIQYSVNENGTHINALVGNVFVDGQDGNDETDIYLSGDVRVCILLSVYVSLKGRRFTVSGRTYIYI